MFGNILSRLLKLMVPFFLLALLLAPFVGVATADAESHVLAFVGMSGFVLAFSHLAFDFLAWQKRRKDARTRLSTIVALLPLLQPLVLQFFESLRPAPEPEPWPPGSVPVSPEEWAMAWNQAEAMGPVVAPDGRPKLQIA